MKKRETTMMAVVAVAAMGVFAEGDVAGGRPPVVATQALAIQKNVPGGTYTETFELDAKVVAIDHIARTATLMGPAGNMLTVTAGPDAINFDQLGKGDKVKATVSSTVEVFLGGKDAAADDGMVDMAMLAPPGAMPGGMMVGVVRATATVTAIDPVERTATLRFEDGGSKTVKVRDDIDLDGGKVGQKVVIRSTEMVAICSEKK